MTAASDPADLGVAEAAELLARRALSAVELAEALVEWYRSGDRGLLDAYSETCLRRVWRAEHFSWWMTSMLHRVEEDDDFGLELQLAQLRYVTTSTAAATSLAENYVGIEF